MSKNVEIQGFWNATIFPLFFYITTFGEWAQTPWTYPTHGSDSVSNIDQEFIINFASSGFSCAIVYATAQAVRNLNPIDELLIICSSRPETRIRVACNLLTNRAMFLFAFSWFFAIIRFKRVIYQRWTRNLTCGRVLSTPIRSPLLLLLTRDSMTQSYSYISINFSSDTKVLMTRFPGTHLQGIHFRGICKRAHYLEIRTVKFVQTTPLPQKIPLRCVLVWQYSPRVLYSEANDVDFGAHFYLVCSLLSLHHHFVTLINLNQWKSLRFCENSFTFSHCSTTENIQWIFS